MNPKATVAVVAVSAFPVNEPDVTCKTVAVIIPEVLIEPSPVNPKATVATVALVAVAVIPEVFTELDVNVVAVVASVALNEPAVEAAVITPEVLIEPSPVNPRATVAAVHLQCLQ